MIRVVSKGWQKAAKSGAEKCTLPFLKAFFLIFVVLENLFENEKDHNSKTEQVMVLEKVEGQILYCINNMNKDETVQEQGILVWGPE